MRAEPDHVYEVLRVLLERRTEHVQCMDTSSGVNDRSKGCAWRNLRGLSVSQSVSECTHTEDFPMCDSVRDTADTAVSRLQNILLLWTPLPARGEIR